MKRYIVFCIILCLTFTAMAEQVRIDVAKGASARELYAKEYLKETHC